MSTLLSSKFKINIIDPEGCNDFIRKYKGVSRGREKAWSLAVH